MIINTNVNSLINNNILRLHDNDLRLRTERLSSGLRINKAADDPSGLAISKGMTAQIRGTDVALQNSQDGISLIQTMDGGLAEVQDMLLRMRDLALKASNEAVLTTDDRTKLNNEMQSLINEIDRMANATTFNGKQILVGNPLTSGVSSGPPLTNLTFNTDLSGWAYYASPAWNPGTVNWDAGYGGSVHININGTPGGAGLIQTLSTPLKAGDTISLRAYLAQLSVMQTSCQVRILDNANNILEFSLG